MNFGADIGTCCGEIFRWTNYRREYNYQRRVISAYSGCLIFPCSVDRRPTAGRDFPGTPALIVSGKVYSVCLQAGIEFRLGREKVVVMQITYLALALISKVDRLLW